MKKLRRLALLTGGLLLLSAVSFVSATRRVPGPAPAAPVAQAFTPGCALPFEAIKLAHPIDRRCPEGGSEGTGGKAPHRLQNEAKNDFCATGTPVPVGFNVFVALQTAVNHMHGLQWGEGEKLPPDRSVLHDLKITAGGRQLTIGEGTPVVFVGFVMDAKHDDVEHGEDVNCKTAGNEFNDIHIALSAGPVPKTKPLPNSVRCKSITAEISPHFRPASWDKFDTAANKKAFRTHPVRLTGTLLFDAAHRPCTGGKPLPGNPVRISIWEIHPVYAIDVCRNTSLAKCQVGDDSVWTPFDQFTP